MIYSPPHSKLDTTLKLVLDAPAYSPQASIDLELKRRGSCVDLLGSPIRDDWAVIFFPSSKTLDRGCGAAAPQEPSDMNIDHLGKSECWNRWNKRLNEMTLDHTSERG
ncbi:hypothetical protein TNCV_284451 [Trichonephila clavipes]|uniref:Uncharacterized protein n=1 Tax=Trichonephila clavipes TaxID=2585209 RepID=A0A8X6SNM9_TRICX|nr:hypothetical protein TNCV_284451 [Trichonephila clavipes]